MEDSKSGVVEEETLLANAEMDEKKQMAAPENSVPNDLEFVGSKIRKIFRRRGFQLRTLKWRRRLTLKW